MNGIHTNFSAPKYDGGTYHGQIDVCLNKEGYIDSVLLVKASGYQGLDQAMMAAIKETSPIINMPDNDCLVDAFYFKKFNLYYDHNDMQR